MNRRLSLVGILVTIAYLGVGAYVLRGRLGEFQQLPLNNLGDFLAGAFGPLTIFWLVLGFLQQGEELRLNTKALEVQAEELKNSVEQQRKLVEFTKDDHDAKRRAALPKFVVHSADARFPIADRTLYKARISNVGSTATELRLSFSPPLSKVAPQEFPALAPSGTLSFEFEHDKQNPASQVRMVIAFIDSMGTPGEAHFILRTYWSEKDTTIEFDRAER